MKLTKNETELLKLLLKNAKTTDAEIAKRLRISSQAVGKIRKKLEQTIIKSYNIDIDPTKLGITVFAISLAQLTPIGAQEGELEIEELLKQIPEVTNVYRLPLGGYTHIIHYAFLDIEDLDSFFHTHKIHSYLENKQLFTFSNHSRIKDSERQLFEKVAGTPDKGQRFKYGEIRRFKKRI